MSEFHIGLDRRQLLHHHQSDNLPMQPVYCLTDVDPTVCARASQSRLHKHDPCLALITNVAILEGN